MKNVSKSSRPLLPALLFIILVIDAAWQAGPGKNIGETKQYSDTTKPKQPVNDKDEPRIKDLDKAMKELDEAMKKLDVEMKKIDFGKIEQEMKDALSKVDMKKVEAEMKASLDKIDRKKISEDVTKSLKEAEIQMKEIDFQKMEKDMKQLKLDMSQHQLDLKIDMDKMQKEIAEEMKKAKVDMQRAKVDMEKAKVDMEKAKEEIRQVDAFTGELQKDGLIDKKKGYKVEMKSGELYINGKKQSKETMEKYRRFYPKDNFTINADGDKIIEI